MQVDQGSYSNSPYEGYLILGKLNNEYLSLSPRHIQSRNLANGERLIINGNGGELLLGYHDDVGIGTSILSAKLHIYDIAETVKLEFHPDGHGYITFHEYPSIRRAWLGFPNDGAEDFYISNEYYYGDIYLLADPGYLRIENSGSLFTNPNGLNYIGDHKNMQYNNSTGEIGYDNSSRRFQINIQTLEDDWHKLFKVRPVTYNPPGSPDYQEFGYVAEEVDSVGLSNLVEYDQEGIPDDVKYDRIVIYLTEIIKKQQKSIIDLKKQNLSFDERIQQLEKNK